MINNLPINTLSVNTSYAPTEYPEPVPTTITATNLWFTAEEVET